MGRIYYLLGKSATGKDTLYKEILKRRPKLRTVTMYTTRTIRDGETDGVEYFFTGREELERQLSLHPGIKTVCITSTTPPSTAFRIFSTALTKTFPSLRATAPPASRFQTFPPAPFAWPLRSLAFCLSSASTPSSRNTSSEALPLAL